MTELVLLIGLHQMQTAIKFILLEQVNDRDIIIMNISPWSIYDEQFKLNQHSRKKSIKSPSSPTRQKTHKSQPKSHMLKQQPFYSYSSTKPIQKSCNMLLLLKILRHQLAQEQLKCLSLPKIGNPMGSPKQKPYVRHNHHHRIKLIKMKQGLSQKIIQKIDQSNLSERMVVFNYNPFSDDKLIETRDVQTERDRKKFKMDTIIPYDMIV